MDERFMGWSGGGGGRTIAQEGWLGKYERRPLFPGKLAQKPRHKPEQP